MCGLTVELREARVTDECDDEVALASLCRDVEQLIFGVHVDADFCDAGVEPVGECRFLEKESDLFFGAKLQYGIIY